jgi:hypothetical protein
MEFTFIRKGFFSSKTLPFRDEMENHTLGIFLFFSFLPSVFLMRVKGK